MQTAIDVSPELKAAFESTSTRALYATIDDEAVLLKDTMEICADPEEDFEAVKAKINECCYVLYNIGDNRWILVSFVPEETPVRLKMLMSSVSKALKASLDPSVFKKDFFATDLDELTFVAMNRLESADDALADHEKEQLAAERNAGEIAVQSSASIQFQLTEPATAGVATFLAGESTFMTLTVNPDTEQVEMGVTGDERPALDGAAFVLHRVEGKLVFIMFMPESTPVKEKVMLTTCAKPLRDQLVGLGAAIDVKVDCRAAEDFDETVKAAIEPEEDATMEYKPRFKRPARPGRRR